MTAIRILIATTGGAVAIDRITTECAPQSMVCLKRSSQVLPISGDYDDFVRPGSGIIIREFGGVSYRLDLAEPIGTGLSWQLGFYLAHALTAFVGSHLAEPGEQPDITCLVSGKVNYNLEVEPIDHITDKLLAGMPLFEDATQNICLILPAGANADDASRLLSSKNIQIYPCKTIGDALEAVGIKNSGSTLLPIEHTGMIGTHDRPRRLIVFVLFGVAVILLSALVWTPKKKLSEVFSDRIDVTEGSEVVETPKSGPAATRDAAPTNNPVHGNMTVFGKYPPNGKRCANLLFGNAKPELRPFAVGGQKPCGFQINIDAGAHSQFVGVFIKTLSGRLIERAPRAEAFQGATQIDQPLVLNMDVPLKQDTQVDVMVSTVLGERSVEETLLKLRDADKIGDVSIGANETIMSVRLKVPD